MQNRGILSQQSYSQLHTPGWQKALGLRPEYALLHCSLQRVQLHPSQLHMPTTELHLLACVIGELDSMASVPLTATFFEYGAIDILANQI